MTWSDHEFTDLPDADFLVATAPDGPSAVTQAEAIAAFGRPYQRYHYQGYTIMVWRRNLLTELRSFSPAD